MSLTRSQTIIVGAVGLVIILVLLLAAGIIPGARTVKPIQVELSFWGPKKEEAGVNSVISRYTQLNKGTTLKYVGFPEADYEDALIDALAAGTGPDMFFIQNDWVQKHKNKISPAPQELIDPIRVTELFPQVVGQDLSLGGKIYGLPFSIDTLALVYNRSIFDSKQIPVPPVTWDGVKALIPKLRELNAGKLTKAAIALGSSEDFVVNSTDILTSIMMQVGVQMVDASTGKVSFYSQKGLQALKFYADFADPLSPNYAWDDSIGNSIDAFAQGKTAMAFLYSSQLPAVRARNPLLMPNVGVLPLPQFNQDSSANLASFWAMAVSNRVSNYAAAWNFINFAATDRSAASSYVSSTGNPPALRSLISDYRQNSSLKVFVSQALIATDWPVPDDRKVRTIFDNMIESYLKDKLSADNILKTAQEEVASIIKR